jgi:hypothetical protein
MTAQPADLFADEHPQRDPIRDLHEIVRKLGTTRSRIVEIESTARADLEDATQRITDWAERETKSDRSYCDLLEAQAASILAEYITANPKGAKSIDTPWGKVCSRDGGLDVRWPTDDAVLLADPELAGYIVHGDPVIPPPRIDKARLRKECKVVGHRLQLPSGAHVPCVEVFGKGRTVVVETR